MKYTASGANVTTFGIATNKSWRDDSGELKELAEFHNIVCWNKLAEICQQLLAKGMKVYVEGALNTRSWEADDGSKRYRTEVRITDMILLDSKGKQGVGIDEDETPEAPQDEEEPPIDDEEAPEDNDPLEEDLPF
jgi:single-strand DNA-binding protein